MSSIPRRRGFALIAVVIFVTLFLGLWAVSARQVGSMLRIEQARAKRIRVDPQMRALAKAAAAIEVGFPPTSFYQCKVQDDVSGGSGSWFVVTFQLVTVPSVNSSQWAIAVVGATDGSDSNNPTLDISLFQPKPPTS